MTKKNGYMLAAGTTVAAALTRWFLDPLLGSTGQFLVFYFSVVITALSGLVGPVLVALAAGAISGTGYFILLGHAGPDLVDDFTRLGCFLLFGGVTVLVAKRTEMAERAAYLAQGLTRTHDLLQSVIEGTSDLIAAHDAEYRYILLNRAYCEVFKKVFGKEPALGASVTEVLSGLPEDCNRVVEGCRRALQGEAFTSTCTYGQGMETLAFEMRFSPLRDSSGKIVGGAHIVREVSERVRTEEALRTSQTRLAMALDAGNVGTWWRDLISGTEIRDAHMNKIMGLPQQETVSTFVEYQSHVHKDDLSRLQACWASAIQAKSIYECEYRLIRPDREIRWVRSRGRLIEDQPDKVCASGAILDITEVNRQSSAPPARRYGG